MTTPVETIPRRDWVRVATRIHLGEVASDREIWPRHVVTNWVFPIDTLCGSTTHTAEAVCGFPAQNKRFVDGTGFGTRIALFGTAARCSSMTLTISKAARFNFVPLRDAMLCVECEFITPAGNNQCSICGRDKLISLSELLEVLIAKACDGTPPITLARLARLIPLNYLRSRTARSPESPDGGPHLPA